LAPCLEEAELGVTDRGVLELTFARSFDLNEVKKKQEYLSAAIWDRLGKKPELSFVFNPKSKHHKEGGHIQNQSLLKEEGGVHTAHNVEEVVDSEGLPPSVSSETFSVQSEVSRGDLPPVESDPWVKKVLEHFPGELKPQDEDL